MIGDLLDVECEGVCSEQGASNPAVYRSQVGWVTQAAMGTNPPTVLMPVAMR